MLKSLNAFRIVVAALCVLFAVAGVRAQNAGTIQGVVKDPSGGVVPAAQVQINDPVSGFQRETTTGSDGTFQFTNVPFNTYHMVVSAAGFASNAQDVDVRSSVPVSLEISLKVGAANQTVTVEANTLVENTSTFHTDVDQAIIEKLPLESQSSQISSLVTLSTPGVTADSNGLFHGMGDHASNAFSVDGQPITDQQSKVFSNQIPLDSVQSMEVISGAPPAEYGGKTNLVINITTRSGLGSTTPHGTATGSYGSFGTSGAGFDLAYGNRNLGNYIAVSGLNSGRFLDPPEFTAIHDKGNEENVFDRIDDQFTSADSLHLDSGYTRSWFQNPNSFSNLNTGVTVGDLLGTANPTLVGPTDQRVQIQTFNVAPTWTHLFSTTTLFTLGAWVRRDAYDYYPSGNALADLGPPSLQRESVGQNRSLANAGARSDISYVKGKHNIKAGITYEQTFLTENDRLGVVDPTLNAPCLAPSAAPDGSAIFAPVPGFTDPSQCAAANLQQNVASNPNAPASSLNPNSNPTIANLYPLFTTDLLAYDLTRGGAYFPFHGHADVKELALYAQDAITAGGWNFNLGLRFDRYNGITSASQVEPRLGISYDIKPTKTVLRISYARTLQSPFNENLLVSSYGCNFAVIADLVPCVPAPVVPGFRNEFHAGLEQAFGQHFVIDGEYIWMYTHNAYDFSDLGNTPIYFPIVWHNSKIPGYAVRASVPNFHGFTALAVFSSFAARFFTPQVGGLGAVPATGGGFSVFRIDHDEHFNSTAHLQYQPWKRWPWLGFNWRYDSGLVAGASPCYGINASNTCPGSVLINGVPNISMLVANAGAVPLTADQEFQAGFTCNGVAATPTVALPFNCPASEFGSTLIQVPASNMENDDHNPPRIQPRSLFDLAVGDDNLFHGDRYKWSLQFTVVNLTDKKALYNFLSTFSGTHYVTPRAETVQLGFHF